MLTLALLIAVPGLVATYSDGARELSVVEATPHFSLKANESVHPAIKPAFRAIYVGRLDVKDPGKYKLVPGAATVTLDGKALDGNPRELAVGLHALTIEYRRPAGAARLQVLWESDAFGPEPLPASVLSHTATPEVAVRGQRLERGRALVDQLNCAGCHSQATPAKDAHGRGPVLTEVGGRTTAGWIYRWLENPTSYRSTARMPVMALSEDERRDVASYLGGLGGSMAGARPTPDPGDVGRGKEVFDRVGCAACHGGDHAPVSLANIGSKSWLMAIEEYLKGPDKVEPTGRMPEMALKPHERAQVAIYLSSLRGAPAFEATVPAGDPVRGKTLVAERGCLGCHTIEERGKPLANALKAPTMTMTMMTTMTSSTRGCLAPTPPATAPNFRLGDQDRRAIAEALAIPDVAPAPAVAFRREVAYHGCQSCHELGAPAQAAHKDVPPSLTDTGNKLRTAWIREVVGTPRQRLRHWFELRMPTFKHAGELADGFAAVAGADREEPPAVAIKSADAGQMPRGLKYMGRGEEGMACITCHDFKAYRSGAATPAPDMASTYRRLRPDYFKRWLRAPGRISPGTQMPAYFTDVARDTTEKRIDDLWVALSFENDLPMPEGAMAAGQMVKLAPSKAPVVFRTFLVGGSARSITVGFPGGQAYAFDGETCRLQFAWSGEFLDVRPVWFERGGRQAVPLGNVYHQPGKLFPLRVGDPNWVTVPRFRGYVLDKGVPVFRYDIGGAEVRDRFDPLADGKGLLRTIEVRNAGEAWFVPGSTTGMEIIGAQQDAPGRYRAAARGGVARFQVKILPSLPAAPRQSVAR